MNTITPFSYSQNVSTFNINNKQPVYKIPLTATDSIHFVEKNPIPKPTKMLFSLLKSGLNDEKVNENDFKGCTVDDWVNMYELSRKNAVTVIAYDGLKKSKNIDVPFFLKPSFEESKEYAENYHRRQEKILGDFSQKTAEKGISTVQMKGIGFSMNYPNPTSRFGGDLDIFNFKTGTNPAEAKNNKTFVVDDIAKEIGAKVDTDHGVKHSYIVYKNMPIENHRNFLNVECGPLHKKMNDYLFKVLNPHTETLPHGTKVLVPSKEFNTVFIAFHSLQHFVSGGLNLHQLTDWAVHIKKNGLVVPKEAKGTKFEEYMYALTNVSNKYLGTKVKAPKNQRLESLIEHEIMNVSEEDFSKKTTLQKINFKYKRMKKKEALNKEFFGSGSMTKAIFSCIKKHVLDPKTMKDLLTKC